MKKLKVMIMYANAGNGHRRAAEALHKLCIQNENFSEVELLDVLDYTNKVFQDLYSNLYIETVKAAPAIWSWVFDETDQPWKKEKTRKLVERLSSQPLLRKIKKIKPDICISTHFMPATIISYLLNKKKISCHHSVVVTDYYVHASWLTSPVCRYFVAKNESKVQLTSIGFPENRISALGIPIDHIFSQEHDIVALRKKHNIKGDKPLILLSAGAFGIMSGNDLLQMIKTITEPCNIAIICGKNKKLKKQISEKIGKIESEDVKYHVLGFTTEMHEWMAMSSLYIGKPGGLTTSECLAIGLPMVIWEPIPGQETYNTAYLLENGAAISPDSSLTLGYRINELLKNPKKISRLSLSASELGNPNAGDKIIETILENLHEIPVNVKRKHDIFNKLLTISAVRRRKNKKLLANIISNNS